MSQGDLTAELCSMLAVWLVLPFYLLAYLLTCLLTLEQITPTVEVLCWARREEAESPL